MKSGAERIKQHRERLKAKGICIICSVTPAQSQKTMCEACQAAAYARVVARRERLREQKAA